MSELRSRTAGSVPSTDPRQDDAERCADAIALALRAWSAGERCCDCVAPRSCHSWGCLREARS